MATSIDTIFKIAASVTGGNAVTDLGNQIRNLSSGSDNLKRNFTQLGTTLKGFAAAEATQAIAGFLKTSIDLGDQLYNLSKQTGISASELGKYKVTADETGVGLDGVANDVDRLNKNMIAGQNGTGPAGAAFRSMGLSVKDAQGNIKNADTELGEIADRFASFPDGPIKGALAIAIFGRAGDNMIPMLDRGSDGIQKFGLVIDQDFADASHNFNDHLVEMRAGMSQISIDITGELLPAVNDAATAFTDLFEKDDITDLAQDFGMILSDSFRVVAVSIVGTIEGVRQLIDAFELLAKAVDDLRPSNIGHIFSDLEKDTQDYMASVTASQQRFGKVFNTNVQNSFAAKGGDDLDGFSDDMLFSMIDDGKKSGSNTPNFNPDQAAEMEKVTKEVQKKIAALNTDTNSIDLNNQEQEKAKLLSEFEAKGLSRNSELYKELSAAIDANTASHRTFEAGAYKALNDYMDTATNVAKQTETVFTDSFKGIEDALVQFTTTGKLSFSSFAQSVISDLARIEIQENITGPLASTLRSGLGSLFSGGPSEADDMTDFFTDPDALFANGGIMTSRGALPLHKYAAGGVASSPQLAVFGEGRLNEAYVPLPDGRSIPVSMTGGGMANISVTINVDGSQDVKSDATSGQQFGVAVASVVKSMLIDEKRPGGILAQA